MCALAAHINLRYVYYHTRNINIHRSITQVGFSRCVYTIYLYTDPGLGRAMSGAALLDQMRQQAIDYGTDYRRAQVYTHTHACMHTWTHVCKGACLYAPTTGATTEPTGDEYES